MDFNVNNFLSLKAQDDLCRYSAYLVCAAAIIIGLKAFGKNVVKEVLGDKKSDHLTQEEKFAYAVLFAAGIVCVWCNYLRK
jgi:phosphate/sulfate permease